jgi:hypothetical protein
MLSSSEPRMCTTLDTPLPRLCSQSCSQGSRLERTSADVGGSTQAADQDTLTSADAHVLPGSNPKVPGSRPGRPTEKKAH